MSRIVAASFLIASSLFITPVGNARPLNDPSTLPRQSHAKLAAMVLRVNIQASNPPDIVGDDRKRSITIAAPVDGSTPFMVAGSGFHDPYRITVTPLLSTSNSIDLSVVLEQFRYVDVDRKSIEPDPEGERKVSRQLVALQKPFSIHWQGQELQFTVEWPQDK